MVHEELSALKQAKLLREVLTNAAAFDDWILRHPRGFAAALGFCGPPQRLFETISSSIKKSRYPQMADKKREGRKATLEGKPQFSGLEQLRDNIPWNAAIDLFGEIKAARRKTEILVPLIDYVLELQSLMERAYKPAVDVDLKPKIDKATKLIRSTLTDVAVHDVNSAQKKLREVESAVQDVRESWKA